ncbi:MAG: RDD family protein [Bacilli bacterium]|nr:RDD family protein [Bacilli bacterium]
MAKELKKASFIKRLCAYAIDFLIILMATSILSIPFTDSEKVLEIQKETNTVLQQYQAGEIMPNEYLSRVSDVYYRLGRESGINTFIEIILGILYYVVFQLYNKGQTIGKKIMGIKIVSDTGDLSMNQMIFRAFISNTILLNIINFGFVTFAGRMVYTGVLSTFTMLQYVITFISILLATTTEGRTIHDRIAHTRVVSIK